MRRGYHFWGEKEKAASTHSIPLNFPADGTLLGNKVVQGACAKLLAYTAPGKDTTGALHLFCQVLLCK